MKAPEAFRGISEVAESLGVRQHTLRAWETRYPFVKPVKRPDGRRYYRPGDIAVLRELKRLIDDEKRSVADILRLHRKGGLRGVPHPSAPIGGRLSQILAELVAAGVRLRVALRLPAD